MIIKHHALERYYLERRLQLLEIFDAFANQSFEEEDFFMDNNHWKIKLLEREFSDVIDPENLCETLRQIYPKHLFGIKSKNSSK